MRRRREALAVEEPLPAAPCKICGLTVKAGRGVADREVFTGSVGPTGATAIHGRLRLGGQNWRRRHDECVESWGWIVGAVLGASMTDVEALKVVERAGVEVVAFQAGKVAARRRFDFLGPDEIASLHRAWDHVRPRSRGARCDSGACSWCGIGVSAGWIDGPLSWSDGSRAPLCGPCGEEWERAGSPTEPDDVRYVAQSRLTSVPRHLGGEHNGMRLYSDLADADHLGTERAWEYAPEGLREVRMRAWRAAPKYAPELTRETIVRRLRIEARRTAAEQAEAEAAARPGADIVWT